jgi:hypothetical protein
VRPSGFIAITLGEKDELGWVAMTVAKIIDMVTANGRHCVSRE